MASINLTQDINDAAKRLESSEQILGRELMMPFSPDSSGSRKLMYSSQLEQRMTLMNGEIPVISTGYETEFGKKSSTFVTADQDSEVLAIIPKYKDLPKLLQELTATDILNSILLPAMAEVGDLMSAGKLQLPFVLKSAQVMSQASEQLKSHFAQNADTKGPKFVLATVRGDVHDIGKNLVKMILSNNGITVIDLGIKVPVEDVVAAVKEHQPAAVGLSGLLVSSAEAMVDYLKAFNETGFTMPVLVGGAALTPSFTKETLAPAYPNGQVFYCRDAFDDLSHLK